MSAWNGTETKEAVTVREPGLVAQVKRILITRWQGRERVTEEAGAWTTCKECLNGDQPHRHSSAVIAVPSQSFEKQPQWYYTRYSWYADLYECPCPRTLRHGQPCKHQASVENVLKAERKAKGEPVVATVARKPQRLEEIW